MCGHSLPLGKNLRVEIHSSLDRTVLGCGGGVEVQHKRMPGAFLLVLKVAFLPIPQTVWGGGTLK